MQENKPRLIVGLGNPTPEYSHTRHNVGFMAIDKIVESGAKWQNAHNAIYTCVNRGGKKYIFAKPQTFMNDSGRAVAALMTYYKIPLENITIIHDDMDLPIGKIRVKTGGGSAGHNGIRSIDAAVGNEYQRIRVGIGHPRDFNSPIAPSDWVLGKFPPEQQHKIDTAIEQIAEIIQ